MSREAKLYDALKRIASYTPPDRMRRDNERGRGYGLDADEEIAMAYENVINEAKHAIKGMRRPKPKEPRREVQAMRADSDDDSHSLLNMRRVRSPMAAIPAQEPRRE